MELKSINEQTFADEVENCDKPVLIDIWATWCGPCKQMMPVVEAFAESSKDIKVVKVDADENKDLVTRFRIRGVPSFILLNKGEVVAVKSGVMTGAQLKQWVENSI